jgi:hypothetical protein
VVRCLVGEASSEVVGGLKTHFRSLQFVYVIIMSVVDVLLHG